MVNEAELLRAELVDCEMPEQEASDLAIAIHGTSESKHTAQESLEIRERFRAMIEAWQAQQ